MKSLIAILCIIAFSSYLTAGQSSKEAVFYQHDSTDHPSNMIFLESDKKALEQCDAPSKNTFSVWDYSVVIGMLVVSLGIGVFYGFFQKSESAAEFMLGSEMGLFPVTLSLTTSFITAIELLGNPSEMFFNGTQFAMIVVSMVLVIPVALIFFYPIYFKMQLTSCYEYLGMRFSKELRIFGAVLYIIQMSFYTSVAVLAPAIALNAATGLNTRLAIVLIYIVCVFYSSQGGLKAVVIADTFQAIVLFISLIMILGLGTYYTGGLTEIFQTAENQGRMELFNINLSLTTRHTVWSVVIGGFFYWTSLFCVNQATVQKSMSLRKIGRAKIALTLSIFGLILVFLINFYTGLMAFTHYKNCDPLKSGQISAIDQLLPFYVMDVFKHRFVSGIFVAGIFAASLGTVAAALSSLSAVTIEDLLVAGMNIKIPAEKGAMYAKWMSAGFGLFSFGLIFIVERLGGILQATLTLNGLVGGVMLGLFSLGVFFKKSNAKGALYGGLVALLLVICLGVVAQLKGDEVKFLDSSVEGCECSITPADVDPLSQDEENEDDFWNSWYKISYMWYSCLGCILTIFFGLLISMITDFYNNRQITKITNVSPAPSANSENRSNAGSLYRTRKISQFLSNVAQDVNLHYTDKSEDKANIIDTGSRTDELNYIGYIENQNYAHPSRSVDNSSNKEKARPDKLHGEINRAMTMDE